MECCCVRVPAIGKKRDRFEEADDFPSSSSPVVFIPVPASKSTVLSSPSLLPPSDPDPAGFSAGNLLCSLRCPGTDSFVLFFPIGTNSHRLGFLAVPGSGGIQSVSCSSEYRIRAITAILNSGEGNNEDFIGHVMVETMYSVDWFSVKPGTPLATLCRSGEGKVFRSSAVVCSRWNPHLPGESAVLLESGKLFLSDVDSGGPGRVRGKRFSLPPRDPLLRWVSFDFGWNPRTVIVARYDAIFVVALGSTETTSCLMRVEDLLDYSPVRDERFVSVARSGEEGSRFALVTNRLLVLCDAREPSKPLVQWFHGFSDDPCHVEVFGSCIVLGSFRNSRFRMFFYGPCSEAETRTALTRMEAEFGERLCGWNQGTDLLISGHRAVPLLSSEQRRRGIEKESVLGLAVVDREIDLREGFTLVWLVSSGNLESQRYSPSVEKKKTTTKEERDPEELETTTPLTFDYAEERYEFQRRFLYFGVGFLGAHLGSKLGKALDLARSRAVETTSPGPEFHEALCEKLSSCGLGRARSAPLVSIVFRDVGPASTLHEVVLRRMWADLPVELSLLAFVPESELQPSLFDAPPEFVTVPDLPRQLPPFVLRRPARQGLRRHRRSHPNDRDDGSLVGPAVPLPILLELHEFHNGAHGEEEENGFSVDAEHKLRCAEIVEIARELATGDSVSLADDGDEAWVGSRAAKRFVLHKPGAFLSSAANEEEEEEVFGTLISRVAEKRDKVGGNGDAELFDSLCPLKLRFDYSSSVDFGTNELKAFKLLKRQFANWQKGFDLYQECCASKFLT